MKKLKPKTSSLSDPLSGLEENEKPYEIIYADPRDEEIHLQILKKAQLNAHMARWFLDIEYNHFLWSDGVYEILEIDPKKSGASYDTFLEVVHPEDRQIKGDTQNELYRTRKPIEITYRLQMVDGRIKWINEICNADFDQSGNPIRFYGIIQDITRYKISEDIFKQKEESYKTLIDSLPSGIAYYQNNKIIFINPAGIRILGAKKANELVGQPVSRFVYRGSIQNFQKKMDEVAQGKSSSSFEEKLKRLDGSVFDAEITPIQTSFNGIPAFQVIINNITERKKTEQALKKIEQKYRLLAVNSSDVAWSINSEGIITYVSPFEENLLGSTAEAGIKMKASKFLTPSSVLSSLIELEEMKSIIQVGKKMEPRKLILELINPEGTAKWIEVTSNALYDSNKSFIGFSCICQNITQSKKEEQLLNENKILNENELQLKELIATKDKFFSIIAHDLRSPFNSIIGFLELLQTQYEHFSDSEKKEYINLIAENANTTLSFLENLLIWAKSQTGRISYKPVYQKITPIINTVKKTFTSALNLKRITLNTLFSGDIEIFADTNMLITIFQNLIGNAIKYSNQGGTILITVQKKQDQIEIIVADSGIGMTTETKKKLFRIGEQVSIPGTANEKGSGLGLILCKDFIERHNGSICVESELEKESQFIIRLPQI
jgi:PAS domain S-box-containing protein